MNKLLLGPTTLSVTAAGAALLSNFEHKYLSKLEQRCTPDQASAGCGFTSAPDMVRKKLSSFWVTAGERWGTYVQNFFLVSALGEAHIEYYIDHNHSLVIYSVHLNVLRDILPDCCNLSLMGVLPSLWSSPTATIWHIDAGTEAINCSRAAGVVQGPKGVRRDR